MELNFYWNYDCCLTLPWVRSFYKKKKKKKKEKKEDTADNLHRENESCQPTIWCPVIAPRL